MVWHMVWLTVDTDSAMFINHVFRGEHGSGNTLERCGISDGSTVFFSLSSFPEEMPDHNEFFTNDVVPSVQQTTKGISFFLSSLHIIVSSVLWFIVRSMNPFFYIIIEPFTKLFCCVQSFLNVSGEACLNTKIGSPRKLYLHHNPRKEITLTLSEACQKLCIEK